MHKNSRYTGRSTLPRGYRNDREWGRGDGLEWGMKDSRRAFDAGHHDFEGRRLGMGAPGLHNNFWSHRQASTRRIYRDDSLSSESTDINDALFPDDSYSHRDPYQSRSAREGMGHVRSPLERHRPPPDDTRVPPPPSDWRSNTHDHSPYHSIAQETLSASNSPHPASSRTSPLADAPMEHAPGELVRYRQNDDDDDDDGSDILSDDDQEEDLTPSPRGPESGSYSRWLGPTRGYPADMMGFPVAVPPRNMYGRGVGLPGPMPVPAAITGLARASYHRRHHDRHHRYGVQREEYFDREDSEYAARSDDSYFSGESEGKFSDFYYSDEDNF